MATETTRPARRTIVKGAAWAVPAVAVASAAPAHAASPNPCIGDLCFGCASVHKCCSGGPKAMYWACVTFTNEGDTPVDLTFSFLLNTSANGVVPISGGGTVPAGQTVSFKPQTPREYGNCSTGTYASFEIHFSDGTNQGSAIVPGGDLDGGGNTCPGNTTCGPCAPSGQSLTQSQPAAETTVEEAPVEEPTADETPVEEPTADEAPVEEPAFDAPAVEETEPVEEQTVDTAEVTSAPDVSTDESTENN